MWKNLVLNARPKIGVRDNLTSDYIFPLPYYQYNVLVSNKKYLTFL